jgi:hypothetical protein
MSCDYATVYGTITLYLSLIGEYHKLLMKGDLLISYFTSTGMAFPAPSSGLLTGRRLIEYLITDTQLTQMIVAVRIVYRGFTSIACTLHGSSTWRITVQTGYTVEYAGN